MNLILVEARAYWILFAVAFLGTAVWESFRAKRSLSAPPERRWASHAVVLLATSLVPALFRVSPVVLASMLAGSRFGLLNRPGLPLLVRCVLAFLALDLTRYALHWISHSVTFLWRLHEVHHSDPDFDVSTGVRHHPFEVVFTQGAYLGAVALLAPPVVAVLVAELASTCQSLVMHANASLPVWAEHLLRLVYITPDIHRIHHSAEIAEQSCNLGFILPWWDRIFGTYLAEPAAGQEKMITGLRDVPQDRAFNPFFLFTAPFRRIHPPS